jgi:hypothetical protein
VRRLPPALSSWAHNLFLGTARLLRTYAKGQDPIPPDTTTKEFLRDAGEVLHAILLGGFVILLGAALLREDSESLLPAPGAASSPRDFSEEASAGGAFRALSGTPRIQSYHPAALSGTPRIQSYHPAICSSATLSSLSPHGSPGLAE